jgi:hypothetical protein
MEVILDELQTRGVDIDMRTLSRVWIKDGRGPDADWRTRTGGRGLADADWRTRTGGRGLRAFQPRILTRNVRIFKLKHI